MFWGFGLIVDFAYLLWMHTTLLHNRSSESIFRTSLKGKKGFWESVVEEYQAAEPPTGFQGTN